MMAAWILILLAQNVEAPPKGVRVQGVVRIKGEPGQPKIVQVPQVYQKMCGCAELDPGDLKLSKDGGVQTALVEIPGRYTSFEPREARIVQSHGLYSPRVIVVGKNTEVTFENGDSEVHNVHLVTENLMESLFNVITSPHKTHLEKIGRLGRFTLICDIHSWMKGWVVVTDNPWHALTDADGKFVIDDVSPGKHQLKVWHERLGEKTIEIEVGDKPLDVVVELAGR